jgi:Tfp pilus assembly protein PilN
VIEVNLLPGSGKARRSRRRRSLSLPTFRGLPGDRWVVGAAALVVLALGSIAWMSVAVAGEAEEYEVRIEAAARDSVRLADVIVRTEGLQARRDSIAQRVAVIQEIDGSRYVWPHIMDEVARALPDYTWLSRIQPLTTSGTILFRVEGRAGTYFALTSFMEAMEASPFIRGTTLVSSARGPLQASAGDERTVYNFVLEAEYRDPPPELIQTEPLFDGTVAPPVPGED